MKVGSNIISFERDPEYKRLVAEYDPDDLSLTYSDCFLCGETHAVLRHSKDGVLYRTFCHSTDQ